MKIIDRYMVKGFLGPFIWCLVAFIIIVIIADIFSFINDIVKYKIALGSIIAFYVYYSPTIFIWATPMSVLLATIFVLSNLNKHNEITAMKSSGIGLWRILTPLLVIGFIISIIVFLVNDRVIPTSSKVSNYIRREELEKDKAKSSQAKIIENVAVYGAENRIVFARNYDTQNLTLQDVIIHEHDKAENLISKTTAQKGVWTDGGWKFFKVIIYRSDNAGRILSEPAFFDEKIIPLKEKPRDFANREWKADYVSYRDLKKYIKNFKGVSTRIVKNLFVELNYKIAFPFISLVMILIGTPFAIKTTRGGVLMGMGMSIVIGLLYYTVIAVSYNLGKAGIFPPIVAAWLGNIMFTIIGIHLINKRA